MSTQILVIDDDVIIVSLLSQILKRHGYAVHAAYNGEDGLTLARTLQPSLIILDIMMPGLNGYEVCQQLKANPATAHITVLMLTARGQVDERTQKGQIAMTEQMHGFAVGAADFVSKPVQAALLLKRVETLLWSG